MSKNKKKQHDNDNLANSVMSSNEMTGMATTVPSGKSEVESYKDIYDIPMKAQKGKKKDK